MSSSQLLVTGLLDYVARCHAEQQVLSYSETGVVQRCTYRDMHRRAQMCALALKKLGVRSVDRVASMNVAYHVRQVPAVLSNPDSRPRSNSLQPWQQCRNPRVKQQSASRVLVSGLYV